MNECTRNKMRIILNKYQKKKLTCLLMSVAADENASKGQFRDRKEYERGSKHF